MDPPSQRPVSAPRHHQRSRTSPHGLNLSPLSPTTSGSDSATAMLDLPHYGSHVSYIEGKSAPTTPRILSRSSSRVNFANPSTLAKSKSSVSIATGSRSGTQTPRNRPPRAARDATTRSSDADWLMRAGAVIAAETRESKGQSWLVSRASSTSLSQLDDDDDDDHDSGILDRYRSAASSVKPSRRGSIADDESSPLTTRLSFGPGSRPLSRYNSGFGSRRGSRGHLMNAVAAIEREREGYFDIPEEFVAEPDFVDVDEEVYAANALKQGIDDDLLIRRLVRRNAFGLGGMFESLLGWSLFALNEDDAETDDAELESERDDETDGSVASRAPSKTASFVGSEAVSELNVPPPGEQPEGWEDAAWLISVAARVLL